MLVDEHALGSHPRTIFFVQFGREVRAELAFGIVIDRAANDVGPEREPVVGNVAPGAVELLMPVVEVDRIRGLEGKPSRRNIIMRSPLSSAITSDVTWRA
jgi:hypothetical protein